MKVWEKETWAAQLSRLQSSGLQYFVWGVCDLHNTVASLVGKIKEVMGNLDLPPLPDQD
jgi:hypothetical protein